jgi:hypothetical protein
MDTIDWVTEFARVISCSKCDPAICPKMVRDNGENVPQPGFIGSRFAEKRVLLVGQNPGNPNDRLLYRDRRYTGVLRNLRDNASIENWTRLESVLSEFVPEWPVQRNYFPLQESGLNLDEIAYCNIVRCRTVANSKPSKSMVSECTVNHFERWLTLLRPRVVVFIGKWAFDCGARFANQQRIPCTFMNRKRSLSAMAREENRQQVAAFIRANVFAHANPVGERTR